MELQGKIIAALPERSGTSARGEWKAQDFVIETHDAYPRKMVFSVFGADRLSRFNIQIGQEVVVSFDIDAHEYNGRWFNSIRAYDVRPAANAAPNTTVQSVNQDPFASNVAPSTNPFDVNTANTNQAPASQEQSDDLPF
ncbi:MAG: DUF3127 domain-containing protein [Prevotella sp.]